MCIYCHFDIISVTNVPLEPRLRQSAFTQSIINCKLLTSYIINQVMDETVVTTAVSICRGEGFKCNCSQQGNLR